MKFYVNSSECFWFAGNYVRRAYYSNKGEEMDGEKKGMKKAVVGATRNDMKEPRKRTKDSPAFGL